MRHANQNDDQSIIVNLVEDAVIADAYSPSPLGPDEFQAPGGTRLLGQGLDHMMDSATNPGVEFSQLLARTSGDLNLIHGRRIL